jgi:hypothetical protein
MNDRTDLTPSPAEQALDARGRAAAADLLDRAGARPRPAFDTNAPALLPAPVPTRAPSGGPMRRPRLLALAAALLLVAGGVALAAGRGHDDKGDRAGVTTGEPDPLVPSVIPSGYRLLGAYDGISRVAAERSAGPIDVYGPDREHPELGVFALTGAGPIDPGSASTTTVDGRAVSTYERTGLGRRAVSVESHGSTVVVVGPAVDRDALIRVALGSSATGTEVTVDESTIPDGWRRLTRQPDPLGLMVPGAVSSATTPGHVVSVVQGKVGESATTVAVEVTAGDQDRIDAMRLFLSDVSQTTVRGHPALLGTMVIGDGPSADHARLLIWLERGGEVAVVSSFHSTEAVMRTLAEGLRPATQSEWSDLKERTELGELSSDPDTEPEVGRGTFASGGRWVLRASTGEGPGSVTPSLSVAIPGADITDVGASSGSSGGGAGTDGFIATGHTTSARRHFVSGLVTDAVERVEVRHTDGSTIGPAALVHGHGHNGFVAEVGDERVVVVLLDAAGHEVGRMGFGVGHDGGTSFSGQGTEITTVTVAAPSGPATTTTGG